MGDSVPLVSDLVVVVLGHAKPIINMLTTATAHTYTNSFNMLASFFFLLPLSSSLLQLHIPNTSLTSHSKHSLILVFAVHKTSLTSLPSLQSGCRVIKEAKREDKDARCCVFMRVFLPSSGEKGRLEVVRQSKEQGREMPRKDTDRSW